MSSKINKKGYVLVETIVVVTVLCVILVMLYSAFSTVISNLQRKSLYDNTEYIYKTVLIKNYLEEQLDISIYKNNLITKICEYDCTNGTDERSKLLEFLKVKAIYITIYNTRLLSTNDIMGLLATTQHYIKSLDPDYIDTYRIIIMYDQENNDTSNNIYEYASLQFGDRK